MEKMSKSHEDYLEAIVMLGGTTEVSVRSVDIANKMGVSKASVNKAVTALKEKALAANRIGIHDIIIPEENKKDVEEIPENVRKNLNFICVNNIDQVFRNAVTGMNYAG